MIVIMGFILFRYRTSRLNLVTDLENTKNLSIFRILFFGFFAIGGLFHGSAMIEELDTFQSLDPALKIEVPLFNWVWHLLPEGWFWVRFFVVLMVVSSIGACLGIKTRCSILAFIISSCYVLGYPQFFGKINHNHHIIWIAAILYFSPSGRHYSIMEKRSVAAKNANPQRYFKTIWTMMGLIYFFPGFWKVWTSGFEWGLSQHLQNQLLYKWAQNPDWTVPFPIHEYPFLLSCGGLFVLFFELSFIFLVQFKRTRSFAAITALIFHLTTWLFMDIFFVVMALCLLTFIPWKRMNIQYSNIQLEKDRLIRRSKLPVEILLFGIALFGIFKINSWPLSIYPTFDSTLSRKHTMFKYYTVDQNGHNQELQRSELFKLIPSEKLWQMEQDVISGQINESSFSDQIRKLYKSRETNTSDLKIKRSNLELLEKEKQ